MKNSLAGKNSEIKKPESQVREEEELTKSTEGDSSATGQVALSIDNSMNPPTSGDQKPSSGLRQETPSSDKLRKNTQDPGYQPTSTSTGAERSVTGNNCEAEQQVAPPTNTTHEAANDKDEKHGEADKLTQKIEEITDFLANKLGTIIQEQIKNTLEKENHLNPERTSGKRNNTQKMYSDGAETERKTVENDPQSRHRNEQLYQENTREYRDEGNQNEDEWLDEPAWRTVTRRRWHTRRNQSSSGTIMGTKKDEEMQAAEKTAWLYVGSLKKTTTRDSVVNYLNKNGVTGHLECEELHTLGNKKAFKVGIPFAYLRNTQDPEFWPENIIVRRFRFPRRSTGEGVELN